MLSSVPSSQCCRSLNLGVWTAAARYKFYINRNLLLNCKPSSSITKTLNHFSSTNLPTGFFTNWEMVETKFSPPLPSVQVQACAESAIRRLYRNVYYNSLTISGDFLQQVSSLFFMYYMSAWPYCLNYLSFNKFRFGSLLLCCCLNPETGRAGLTRDPSLFVLSSEDILSTPNVIMLSPKVRNYR